MKCCSSCILSIPAQDLNTVTNISTDFSRICYPGSLSFFTSPVAVSSRARPFLRRTWPSGPRFLLFLTSSFWTQPVTGFQHDSFSDKLFSLFFLWVLPMTKMIYDWYLFLACFFYPTFLPLYLISARLPSFMCACCCIGLSSQADVQKFCWEKAIISPTRLGGPGKATQ